MAQENKELYVLIQFDDIEYYQPVGVTFSGWNNPPYLEGEVETLVHRVACEGQVYRLQDVYTFFLFTKKGKEKLSFKIREENFPSGTLELLPPDEDEAAADATPLLNRLSVASYLCEGVKRLLEKDWRDFPPSERLLLQQSILVFLTGGAGLFLTGVEPEKPPDNFRLEFGFTDESRLALTSQGPEVIFSDGGVLINREEYKQGSVDLQAIPHQGVG